MFWQVFSFVAMFGLLAFVAALILVSPSLMAKLPRRRRFRPPTAAELLVPRPIKAGAPQESRLSRCLPLILMPVTNPQVALLTVVIVPAFAAIYLGVVAQNFRYCRRATYRALRRKSVFCAGCLSYPIGLTVFVRKIAVAG